MGANSPMGGKVVVATIPKDADKGKFPLKDKDSSMAAAFAFLRSKDAFPEDNDDDDDEMGAQPAPTPASAQPARARLPSTACSHTARCTLCMVHDALTLTATLLPWPRLGAC